MLAGLRQHGNFPLPARADMNDVLAALARAAGWTVHADGTTFRSSPQVLPAPPNQLTALPLSFLHRCLNKPLQQGRLHHNPVEAPTLTNNLNSYAIGTPLGSQGSVLHTDDSLSPSSLDSVGVAEQSIKNENYGNSSSVNSLNCMGNDQMDIINSQCQLVDPESVRAELQHLKSLNVDGVIIDCWWGIVEAWIPRKYEWSGYRDLFGIIKEFKLKVQLRYPSCPETMGWRYPGIGEFQVCLKRLIVIVVTKVVGKVRSPRNWTIEWVPSSPNQDE
ncbi:hypothetical protein PR202_ga06354 [Eleusine coracana subsp. coracana]|uniref:Beta-amylase n=1 Tax=Eleusine coracana subsp. coracana TaxID=191504 RepID=A0AAV5BUT7_ELECO|nr:hypothetical protein PR202_ga06354 [Eleusine coracana subsp. coracana]